MLSQRNPENLNKQLALLKDARRFMGKEVNGYLFENYQSFLSNSEALRQVHSEFEELKTMSNQYSLVLSALRTQIDRLSNPQSDGSLY